RQQGIEVPETLEEAAVAGKARVGNDDVIDGTLLGACASEADNDGHRVLLKTWFKVVVEFRPPFRGASEAGEPIMTSGEIWRIFSFLLPQSGEATEAGQRRLVGQACEPRQIRQAGAK